MEGIPDKNDYYHHHQHTVGDLQVAVGRNASTIFYDCIEVGKGGSRDVPDLYTGMVVFSGRRNERDIQEYSRWNNNNRDNKKVVSIKRDISHGGDKNVVCRDFSATSLPKDNVSVLNYYTVIKTAHGVRFRSSMTSPRMFAKGLLNKRTFIGLKPGNKLINKADKDQLKGTNGDKILHEFYNKEGQSVDLGNENSGRLSMKRFYQSRNSNCLPLETDKKTPPNTNYNKAKPNNTHSSSTVDRETQNEILTCGPSIGNYINTKENNTYTDASRLRKQKLQQHMQNSGTFNEQMRRNKSRCKQSNTGQMSAENVLKKKYQFGAFKDCPEGHTAIFGNTDRAKSNNTQNPAKTYEAMENCGLWRQQHRASNNSNSRQKVAAKGNRGINSALGIESLLSLDVKNKASKKSVASSESSRSGDWRLNLLITWNFLQLLFLVVTFLWASLCICSFKKFGPGAVIYWSDFVQELAETGERDILLLSGFPEPEQIIHLKDMHQQEGEAAGHCLVRNVDKNADDDDNSRDLCDPQMGSTFSNYVDPMFDTDEEDKQIPRFTAAVETSCRWE